MGKGKLHHSDYFGDTGSDGAEVERILNASYIKEWRSHSSDKALITTAIITIAKNTWKRPLRIAAIISIIAVINAIATVMIP